MTKEARVYCMTPRRTGHVLCTPPRYKVFSHRWSFGWQQPTGEVLNFSDTLKTAVLVVLYPKAVHPSIIHFKRLIVMSYPLDITGSFRVLGVFLPASAHRPVFFSVFVGFRDTPVTGDHRVTLPLLWCAVNVTPSARPVSTDPGPSLSMSPVPVSVNVTAVCNDDRPTLSLFLLLHRRPGRPPPRGSPIQVRGQPTSRPGPPPYHHHHQPAAAAAVAAAGHSPHTNIAGLRTGSVTRAVSIAAAASHRAILGHTRSQLTPHRDIAGHTGSYKVAPGRIRSHQGHTAYQVNRDTSSHVVTHQDIPSLTAEGRHSHTGANKNTPEHTGTHLLRLVTTEHPGHIIMPLMTPTTESHRDTPGHTAVHGGSHWVTECR